MSSRSAGSGHRNFGRSNEDPRRALTNRLQAHSVQLRKRRKEERLTAKRLGVILSSDGPSSAATLRSNPSATVQSFLEHPFNLQQFASLQELVLSQAGVAFLIQLLEENASLCVSVVSQLSTSLQKPAFKRTALTILQELASVTNPSASASDSYYGRAPLTWQDVLTQDSQLLPTLLALQDPADNSLQTAALTILGILVQQPSSSKNALQFCLHHWSSLLQALPQSSFCCAAVLRHDEITYGMQFFPSPFASTDYLVRLFQHYEQVESFVAAGSENSDATSTRAVVHAAWMLQGLSFREDQVVDFLCTSDDSALLDVVTQVLHNAGQQQDAQVLVPLLQALGNLVTACHGKYVGLVLAKPVFVPTLAQLIVNGKIIDAVPLAGCLLMDCGLVQHPSSTIAAPALLPALAQALRHTSHDWRAQAVQAIATALERPTEPVPHAGWSPAFSDNIIKDAALHTLWEPESSRITTMEAIASLIRPHDLDATFGALTVLEVMFGSVPESHQIFESLQGTRRLDELCNYSGEIVGTELEEAQSLAARLLDMYFDGSDDEDEVGIEDPTALLAPELSGADGANSHYVFGLTASAPTQPSFQQSVSPGSGRGRGRTLPAWMQQ